MASAGGYRALQSTPIVNREGTLLGDFMSQLGAMKVSIPVKAIEKLAANHLANYLSPDRELLNLGHITATTSTDLVRCGPGDDTAIVNPARWLEIAKFLRDDPRCAMNMFVDITAVDYLGRQTPRFEVVMHLRSLERGHRIRLKARIGDEEGQNVDIDSVVSVWRGANWFEREAFDMFGFRFAGHDNLVRILMPEDWEGHPLRKDYPLGGEPVRFSDED